MEAPHFRILGHRGALTDRRREILDLATQTSLTPHVIEKDYVLGWMLAGIYAHEKLGNTSIFKGGTCLKNCFFETYRFSADLDFTLRNGAHLDETFLKRVFAKVGAWVYDETGIEIPWCWRCSSDGRPRGRWKPAELSRRQLLRRFTDSDRLLAGPPDRTDAIRSAVDPSNIAIRSRASSGGAIDVFRCPVCRKVFDRKSYDASVRPHKKLGRLSVLRLIRHIRADKILGLAKRICRLRSVG